MAEVARAQVPDDSWRAQLQLRLESARGRTQLTHCLHSGPLRVQRVFYPEPPSGGLVASALEPGHERLGAEPCHIYLLHPPGGLVSGDALLIEIDCHEHAHALLTTPAASKFYRQHGQRVAQVTQRLRLRGGTLEWLPQENIYYPDSAARLCTQVRLDSQARFIGWELHCLGLPASAARLGHGVVRTALELWRDEQPLLLERLTLEGEALGARWGLAGLPAFGTCLAFPAAAADLERSRSIADGLNCAELILACTIVDGVLCCRGLARRVDQLKHAFIALWQALRPAVLAREAVAPRIWAT